MKKNIIVILIVAMIFCLAACSSKTEPVKQVTEPKPTTAPTTAPTTEPPTEAPTEPPRFTGPFKPYVNDLVDGELYNANLTILEDGKLSIELWQQMFYSKDEILDLQEGDTIEVDDKIITVAAIEKWPVNEENTKWTIVLNPETDNITFLMWHENDEFYRVDDIGRPLMKKTETLEYSVDENVIYIDSAKTNKDGNVVTETGKEFLAAFKKNASDFEYRNTRISFDGPDSLLMICKD